MKIMICFMLKNPYRKQKSHYGKEKTKTLKDCIFNNIGYIMITGYFYYAYYTVSSCLN